MNLLLVDADPIQLNSLDRAVEELMPNASRAAFSSPAQAMQYARANPVDVVLLETAMGELDGLSMARSLSRLNPRLNIIFCTSHAEYALDAFRLFCSDYLLKPVGKDRLDYALHNLRYPAPAG